MKLMIFGIDALPPEILFDNLNKFPNIKKMCENGICGDYDAYAYGYGSYDNWISLYTGLTPKEHGSIGNIYKNSGRKPVIDDYVHSNPFWNEMNKNGVSVGMWKGTNTTPPKKIEGYMIGGEANFEINGSEDPLAEVNPVFCEEDKKLEKYIIGKINRGPVPQKPEEFGYTWEEFLEDNSKVDLVLKDDYFNEAVEYFKKELQFYSVNIRNMQKNNPVDVIFFYTQVLDYIQHFQMHDFEKKQVIEAIKVLDLFIGEVLTDINPERVILISDHGIKALADFFPNTDLNIQKEAFGWSKRSMWLKNGQIVTKGRIGGFLSGIHSLKGTFVASGEGIKRGKIKNMRTVDFYPTLLEMFNIKVPSERSGYVIDIFDKKEIINSGKLLIENKVQYEKIAIIQDTEVPEFNRIINEVFLDNRFSKIDILGEEKYKNIFLANPRVNDFKTIEDRVLNFEAINKYDKIFLTYRNNITNELDYIEIK